MTLQEIKLEEIAEKFIDDEDTGEIFHPNLKGLRGIVLRLVSVLQQVRNAALEEAAGIADRCSIEAFHEMTESCRDASKDYWSNRESQAKHIAKAIRALKTGEEK